MASLSSPPPRHEVQPGLRDVQGTEILKEVFLINLSFSPSLRLVLGPQYTRYKRFQMSFSFKKDLLEVEAPLPRYRVVKKSLENVARGENASNSFAPGTLSCFHLLSLQSRLLSPCPTHSVQTYYVLYCAYSEKRD